MENLSLKKYDRIGSGSYGKVYSATDENGVFYAVKRNIVYKKIDFITSLREMDFLNKFRDHKYICNIVCTSDGDPFNKSNPMSPLIKGDADKNKNDKIHFVFIKADMDLSAYIKSYKYSSFKPLKIMMCDLLLGLEYMHAKGIIHRDIKPNNILVYPNNQVKICDLGYSRRFSFNDDNETKVVTHWYRSPELILSNTDYDKGIDIWAMACTFYDMVSKTPFNSNDDKPGYLINGIINKYPWMINKNELNKINRNKRIRIKNQNLVSEKKASEFLMVSNDKFDKDGLGSLDDLYDLLRNMMRFDFKSRFSATECLNHRFFNSQRDSIEECRKKFPPIIDEEIINMSDFPQRIIMFEIVSQMFNLSLQEKIEWFEMPMLFLTVDIFDRYMTESELGKSHKKINVKVKSYVCLYVSIKYYLVTGYIPSFEEICPPGFVTDYIYSFAESFEYFLIKQVLKGRIHRDNVYDVCPRKLTKKEQRNLLEIYGNKPLKEKTAKECLKIYCNELGINL